MKTYRIAVNQKEYDKLEKAARKKGITMSMHVRLLLGEAKELQEEKCTLGIYIPYSKENEKRDVLLYVSVHKELEEYFSQIASMAKGLKPGKVAQLYLIDILDRKED